MSSEQFKLIPDAWVLDSKELKRKQIVILSLNVFCKVSTRIKALLAFMSQDKSWETFPLLFAVNLNLEKKLWKLLILWNLLKLSLAIRDEKPGEKCVQP